MISQLTTEFIGTFILMAVILVTGEAIPIAIALAGAIFLGGSVSGGHFNPVVSILKLVDGSEHWGVVHTVAYIVFQILGGIAAYYYVKTSGQNIDSFSEFIPTTAVSS